MLCRLPRCASESIHQRYVFLPLQTTQKANYARIEFDRFLRMPPSESCPPADKEAVDTSRHEAFSWPIQPLPAQADPTLQQQHRGTRSSLFSPVQPTPCKTRMIRAYSAGVDTKYTTPSVQSATFRPRGRGEQGTRVAGKAPATKGRRLDCRQM